MIKTYHAWKMVGQGRHWMLSSIIWFEEKKLNSRNVSSVPSGFVVGLESVKNIHHKCSHIHPGEMVLERPLPFPMGHVQEQVAGLSSSPGSAFPPGTPATPPPLLYSHLQGNMSLCHSCHSCCSDVEIKMCIKLERATYIKKKPKKNKEKTNNSSKNNKGGLRNLWVLSPCWMAGLSCTFCRRCPQCHPTRVTCPEKVCTQDLLTQ